MFTAKEFSEIFILSMNDYHILGQNNNPFELGSLKYLIYNKNWIDTVQWHMEDITRDPLISGENMIKFKREIDSSNQERNDIVEKIDDHIFEILSDYLLKSKSQLLNSESPAWILDRLSILELKIFHMNEQTTRVHILEDHKIKCIQKLDVLINQKNDVTNAFDTFINEIIGGTRKYKLYRQMKMYNDSTLNPVLYESKK
jgi:hypothetical protein